MKPSQIAFKTLLAAFSLAAVVGAGCTGDRNGQPRQVVVQHSVQAQECGPESLSQFEKSPAMEGVEITQLPAGVFLYSSAEMRVENRSAKGKSVAEIVVRENHSRESFQSRVVCVERPSTEAASVDTSVHGLTKIEVDRNGTSSITVRQFQAFANPRGQGMIALNPRLQSKPVSSLSEFLAMSGPSAKLYKIDDKTYMMRIERDSSTGTSSTLIVTYDYIPR